MTTEYFEVCNKTISRGRNVNASTIPAKRVVSHTTDATYQDAIDTTAVVGLARLAGVTAKAIETTRVGDVHTEGVVPVESDGTGTILVGDRLAVAGASGRVYSVRATVPATGANVWLVGTAKTSATATAGAVVMVDIHFAPLQGA